MGKPREQVAAHRDYPERQQFGVPWDDEEGLKAHEGSEDQREVGLEVQSLNSVNLEQLHHVEVPQQGKRPENPKVKLLMMDHADEQPHPENEEEAVLEGTDLLGKQVLQEAQHFAFEFGIIQMVSVSRFVYHCYKL